MKIVIDISKDRYDEIMSMDCKNCRRFFDEEIRAIHDGKVLEQEPCDDCISRESVSGCVSTMYYKGLGKQKSLEYILKYVEQLPPVTPQPKMGRWIRVDKEIKTLEDLENHCKKTTGHGMNVPPFVYTDKYFEDIEKAYGNGYRAGYKEGFDYSIGEAQLEEVKKSIIPQPCNDCVSRQELLKAISTWDKFGCDADTKLVPYKDHYVPYIHYDDVINCIKGMPPVTQQQKMGQWIDDKCSECGKGIEDLIDSPEWYRNEEPNFCPYCGAKMEKVEDDRS